MTDDELRKLAEAAELHLGPSEWWGLSHAISRDPEAREYINAADPATILALLDEKAALREVEVAARVVARGGYTVRVEWDALRAALDALDEARRSHA